MPKMTRGLVIRDCTITRLSRAAWSSQGENMFWIKHLQLVRTGRSECRPPATVSSRWTSDSSLSTIFRPRDGTLRRGPGSKGP